mmetsp:Transcript_69185/g.165894  ORF Transcript_69185/g.165894 Transcript_69185/m.165894 type:complete len:240 (+) Transcript_69185:104-823(+)
MTVHSREDRRGGLLPRAHLPSGVTPEVIHRMYFSTSNRDATQDHYRTRPDEARTARAVSMKTVHNINGNVQSATDLARTPLVGKTSYSADYIRRPLDDLDANRALSQLFKEKSKGPQLRADSRPPLDTQTSHKEGFPRRELDMSALGTKSPSSAQVHIDPKAKFLESQSVMQRSFPKLAAEEILRARSEIAQPPKGEAQLAGGVLEGKSLYKREFSASRLNFVPRPAHPQREPQYRLPK